MAKQSSKMLKITLVRSPIGNTERHKATLRALGLHRLGQEVEKEDSPSIRGMLSKVNHLVKIEVQEEK
ncbi:MAG TPA: 50S ribosomal protein L30 [Anaerolineaceae bacterium]|uniref:Large ribosomal subunit protein uL30 n=1 Tax=Anaerolinea thermophila TaxID=167964 RepID=A0A101FZ69_9CHLR|nr:MAG: 50S ribosomal protein L30 [Anaerolinea thermophila]HAF62933.1 50S ribosomal protein L30 [Anaerolineaceae bacterium]